MKPIDLKNDFIYALSLTLHKSINNGKILCIRHYDKTFHAKLLDNLMTVKYNFYFKYKTIKKE